jgi:DNA-3-methyladenine glycosylase I
MPSPSVAKSRCTWPGEDPLYLAYHDEEWGVPERDDRALFEKLTLDGFQAGLSWITILRKREGFRRAFAGFEVAKVAAFGARDVGRLLGDASIVRHRGKIEAAIANARAVLEVQGEVGSFAKLLWGFVGGAPKPNAWTATRQVPPETAESRAMSKALKDRGFTFVGPTVCYAFMQAVGMVNDHLTTCFRHSQLSRRSTSRPT